MREIIKAIPDNDEISPHGTSKDSFFIQKNNKNLLNVLISKINNHILWRLTHISVKSIKSDKVTNNFDILNSVELETAIKQRVRPWKQGVNYQEGELFFY